MFTGLIERKGNVLANELSERGSRLVITKPIEFAQLQTGDSIAVNGVCLTLLAGVQNQLCFDVSPETLNITTIGTLKLGDEVNLERAMLASTRFGGHYVSGHVDTTAHIKAITPLGEFIAMDVAGFSTDAMLYLIPKGSICLNGVSLTINEVGDQTIKLMLVPHTLTMTTLGVLKVEQQVNIEFDYLTRIVAHQLRVAGKLTHEVVS